MNLQRGVRVIDCDQVVTGLTKIREEWQLATDTNLITAKGSIGLILGDIVIAIGLCQEDQEIALGKDLYLILSN